MSVLKDSQTHAGQHRQDLESKDFFLFYFSDKDKTEVKTKQVHHSLLASHRDACEPAQAHRSAWEQLPQPISCELPGISSPPTWPDTSASADEEHFKGTSLECDILWVC